MKCIYLHLGSDDNNQCDMKTFLKLFLVKLKCCFIPCSKPSIELKKTNKNTFTAQKLVSLILYNCSRSW